MLVPQAIRWDSCFASSAHSVTNLLKKFKQLNLDLFRGSLVLGYILWLVSSFARIGVFMLLSNKWIFSMFADPTKYFGCELGANTQFDKKNDRYIVNGSHDPDKLQEILDNFIEKFVLCPECENPETTLV